MDFEKASSSALVEMTADIVSAYVSNNRVTVAELPALIASVFQSLGSLNSTLLKAVELEPLVPAVSIKKSVTDDYIVCLDDGKNFKSLRRHLMADFGMTPKDYRAKWKLPADYPMVAPNFAAARSALSKKLGLGRKPAEPALQPAPEPAAEARKARAPRKEAAAAA